MVGTAAPPARSRPHLLAAKSRTVGQREPFRGIDGRSQESDEQRSERIVDA